MNPRILRSLSLFGILAAGAATLSADLVPLPAATFGGSGIPNQAVAVTTINDGARTLTLGLTAHQRYSNPAVTNDGIDTFFAPAGDEAVFGSPGHQEAGYARWNFGWYVDFGDVAALAEYDVDLWYDNHPGFNSPFVGTSSWVELGQFFAGLSQVSVMQNSWNLGMADFNSGFNPSVDGEYDFALVMSKDGTEVGRSSITVIVGSPVQAVPDTASTLALSGLAMLGLAAATRRRR